MMKTIVFATNNTNKVKEMNELLSGKFHIKNLSDIGCNAELPETHLTIEENSNEKADYIYNCFKVNCFAEDTGLEVEALNGEPGVFSARYAGEDKSAEKNMDKVLDKMKGIANRKARFKTVITLIWNGQPRQFTGILEGEIASEKTGTNGFGYDPIFLVNGKSLAEMTLAEKSALSHRGKATRLLIRYLNTIN